jgi:choline dehydrogenase-like flavoprotein
MPELSVTPDIPSPEVVIIGSGMGDATLAAGLAPTGARIVILERGEQLKDTPETRDARAIFQRGFYRPSRPGPMEPASPSIPGIIMALRAFVWVNSD